MRKYVLLLPPLFVLSAIALGLLPLVGFAWAQGGWFYPDAYALRVLQFTLIQAGLSTLLSVVPAIFVARALARQVFWGRSVLLALFAVPLSLPVIVAIFGLTGLYGTAGIFAGWINLYGIGGILLAHVFFNLPLATRLLLEPLIDEPADGHCLAAQLNFTDLAVWRHLDWPALKPVLPRVAALVFLLCASSFVIVLLFGGPQATTLEVAIFQSLRMDFDVSRALTLTTLQIALSVIMVWAAAKALFLPTTRYSSNLSLLRYDGKTGVLRLVDFCFIAAASFLVLPVLASVLAQGLLHLDFNSGTAKALLTSLVIALLSSILALPLAWGLARAQLRFGEWRGSLTGLSLAGYVVPPAVLATGWFLAFRNFDGGLPLAVLLIAALNALMALPFLMAIVAPALHKAIQHHDMLCEQLNIRGWNRFKLIELPTMRGPLAQATMMTLVLSLGDLTAVTLLGAQGLTTLPSLVQQQMGHYQSDAAGGTALVLAAICLVTSLVAQRFAKWT